MSSGGLLLINVLLSGFYMIIEENLTTFHKCRVLNYNERKINRSWIPEFLKGHARSIIAIAKK